MRNTVFGIVAHVDAGKTTLSEQLLLRGGTVREAGRVDKGTSFLDNNEIERERGITVFSKQARLSLSGRPFTLLDTPGHSDFTGEAERVMSVLDAAILMVSVSSGVNSHTLFLKKLLDRYHIPVIIFVNKTDLPSFDKEGLLSEIRERLGEQCIEASSLYDEGVAEDIALLDDGILGKYLEDGRLPDNAVNKLFLAGKLNPVYLGSALKDEGVDLLCEGLLSLTAPLLEKKAAAGPFSARVFSIEKSDRRLSFMKIMSGRLKVRDQIVTGEEADEKVTEIRLYSGTKYENVPEASEGDIASVAGLEKTYAGQGLGSLRSDIRPFSSAMMRVRLMPDPSIEKNELENALSILSEEEPYLEIEADREKGGFHLSITGALQEEILRSVFLDRFNMKVSFESERPVYAETIKGRIEGVGHYEPLRHYAEVHLLISEGERGSGVIIGSECPTDVLEKTYQRQVLDTLFLLERTGGLRGVLTGSRLTDVRITLVSGKSHVKHTEPGDFREATVRALRHGLMRAENILLEPMLSFSMKLPKELLGRALNDISNMSGVSDPPIRSVDGGSVFINGRLPAAELNDYQKEFSSFTKGEGSLEITPFGFCGMEDPKVIIESFSYDPERDLLNPAGSIFCSHGAGVYIPWDEVEEHMHLPYRYPAKAVSHQALSASGKNAAESRDIKSIMDGLGKSANQKEKPRGRDRDIEKKRKRENELIIKRALDEKKRPYEGMEKVDLPLLQKSDLLLVDGYNIIFAWDELKDLAAVSIDAARGRLNDIISNYSAYRGLETIVVYDAYLLEDHGTEKLKYNNIHIVFTATAETADQYIEKTAIKRKKNASVRVATSDRVERMIVLSQGAVVISAENFRGIIDTAEREIREKL